MGNTFFYFSLAMALSLAATPYSSSKPFQDHLLMPQSDSGRVQSDSGRVQSDSGRVQSDSGRVQPNSGRVQSDGSINCLSWRLAVETNNLRNWEVVPEDCADYVKEYMLDGQYEDDGEESYASLFPPIKSVLSTLKNNNLGASKNYIWIFDIGETALSNLPYYERPDVNFGAKKYNSTKFGKWLEAADAPAVEAVLKLYKRLKKFDIKAVFLSATSEKYLRSRKRNLIKAGYTEWEKLILKPEALKGTSVVEFKSKERAKLEEEGYTIVGSIGDQWRDLIGNHTAPINFKFPNPMYYTG